MLVTLTEQRAADDEELPRGQVLAFTADSRFSSSSSNSMATNGKSTNSSSADGWTPTSWRKLPIKQQAQYPDAAALNKVHDKRTCEGRDDPMCSH